MKPMTKAEHDARIAELQAQLAAAGWVETGDPDLVDSDDWGPGAWAYEVDILQDMVACPEHYAGHGFLVRTRTDS